MNRLSIVKTRWLFGLFFLALAIPSVILSYKAHDQLRWQSLHQYQQDIRAFIQQIDSSLLDALAKEEARSDTEYTFFVLAGTPEARFVQRSELSKYPVESSLAGVLGYFQIDENGKFSSPILPSAEVQSEVVPQLYGISIKENELRNELEKKLKEILSQNKLVLAHKSEATENSVGKTLNDKKTEANVVEGQPLKADTLNRDISEDVVSERDVSESIDADYESKNENQGKLSVTGSRIARTNSFKPTKQASDSSNEMKGFLEGIADSSSIASQQQSDIAERKEQRQIVELKNKSELIKQKRRKKAVYPNSRSSFAETNKKNSRVNRIEKSYSPQQSLLDERKSNQRVEQKNIQINLFESEIEPFQFSLLESGHFVLYRKVLRENKRVIQGAIISSQDFVAKILEKSFLQSSLYEVSAMDVYFSDELLTTIVNIETLNSKTIASVSMRGELLAGVPLVEPFSQFFLEFRITQLPEAAGASFIKMVAGSLLLILILGTLFLYRLTVKQFYLAQQQQNFVSSVSHELKTPLTSIRMYGEILKQGWLSDEKREEYYDYIYTEAERLSRLIANVLQISKVNHNALELNLVSVEISELVSLVKSKVDSQISHSEFTLQIYLDPRLEGQSILVDADGFVQVVINLVDNAIKYASKAKNKQIDLRFELSNIQQIDISVRDYGPGIEKQYIKQVFELFYRSGNELTRETTGTGIGLALVKELCTAMSAEISVENCKPGAKFNIRFKVAND